MRKGRKNYTLIISGKLETVRKWRDESMNGIKAWFHKFSLLFWPWSKIDELEKALTSQNQMLINASARYDNAYRDGFTHHLQTWMANANMFYGPEPFRDGQKTVMIDLYNRGMTIKEALEMLRISEMKSGEMRSKGFHL